MRNDAVAIVRLETDRAADAGVERHIFGQWGEDDAFAKFGLDENGRIIGARPGLRADVKRRVRPRRLRDVLDEGADAQVALDEQHVAGLQHGSKLSRGIRDRGREIGNGPAEIVSEPSAQCLPQSEASVHDVLLLRARGPLASACGVVWASDVGRRDPRVLYSCDSEWSS